MGVLERIISRAVTQAATTAANAAVHAASDAIQENVRAKREEERQKREMEFKREQAEAELEWKKQEAYYNNMAGGAVANEVTDSTFEVNGKVAPDGTIQMTATKTQFYETCPHCQGANTGKAECIYCGASLVKDLNITRTKTNGNNR